MDESQEHACNVDTSWKVGSSQNLSDVVIYRNEEVDEPDSEAEPKASSGLFLICSECGTSDDDSISQSEHQCRPCNIDFEVKCTPIKLTRITAVDILCDASRAEFFTHNLGYTGMEHGTRVDEAVQVKGKLYLVQHSFDDPVQKCSMQMIQTPRINKLWIHTIYVTIKTTSVRPSITDLSLMMTGSQHLSNVSSIDLDKVKTIMADMDAEVTEPAKSLLRTMETFQKNKMMSGQGPSLAPNGGGFGQMAAMMSMFQGLTASAKPTVPLGASKTAGNTEDKQHSDELSQENNSQTLRKNGTIGEKTPAKMDHTSDEHGDHNPREPIQRVGGIPAPPLPLTASLLAPIEQRLQEHISATEQRILGKVTDQLLAVEGRIHAKLDKILEHMSSNQCLSSLSSSSSHSSSESNICEPTVPTS